MRAQPSLEILLSLTLSLAIALVLAGAYVALHGYTARMSVEINSSIYALERSAGALASNTGCFVGG